MKHNLSKNNIKFNKKGIKVDFSFDRFDKQLNNAQSRLTEMVLDDMKPYMPDPDLAEIVDDSTIIAAKGPQGRFLYEGIKMVGVDTGSAFAKSGERKVPVNKSIGGYGQDKSLHYKNPNAAPHWFEAALEARGKNWVKEVKKIAGGGE